MFNRTSSKAIPCLFLLRLIAMGRPLKFPRTISHRRIPAIVKFPICCLLQPIAGRSTKTPSPTTPPIKTNSFALTSDITRMKGFNFLWNSGPTECFSSTKARLIYGFLRQPNRNCFKRFLMLSFLKREAGTAHFKDWMEDANHVRFDFSFV